jgi:crotonobetainyl-CoA:carnitine CoA-transferase CaiB-like acyl-CoA transferase
MLMQDQSSPERNGPLAGLKVVEYATYIAAPGAGGLMADWGADVIKVEPPGGDPIRGFFATIGADMSENPVFDLDNRGKRSIMLDTATQAGRDVLARLASQADIFLTNVRPGGLKRAGLDYETLSAANPRLIYANVTGYGLEGPDVDRPGFDQAAFWARSGWARLTAPKGVAPFPNRTGVGDHICSLATLAGILAAVQGRHTTGKGQQIDSSLLRTGTYTLGSDMAIQMRFGRLASTRSREDAINPLVNFFACADGRWITILPRQGAKDWPAMCKALELEALQADPRFANSKARRENGPALVALMDRAFACKPYSEIAAALDRQDLIWASVQSPAETVADPQFLASGGQVMVDDGTGTPRPSPAGPVRFSSMTDTVRPAAPRAGADTRIILAEAGYSRDEIEAILADHTKTP